MVITLKIIAYVPYFDLELCILGRIILRDGTNAFAMGLAANCISENTALGGDLILGGDFIRRVGVLTARVAHDY